MKKTRTLFIAFISLTLTVPAYAAMGKADVQGTTEGSLVSGIIALTETPEGLRVSGTFRDVPPGKHGFHIHQTGDCGDEGKAAGGHFNPDGAPHGLLSKDGFKHAHAGDLGNVEIAPDGTGNVNALLPGLTLESGDRSVFGKAFILHEKEDDFGQPTGNAGGRIGCGVIEIVG